MTELEKFQLVNTCNTCKELEDAIILIGQENDGMLQGRTHSFNAESMAKCVEPIVNNAMWPNYLTRSYGIRQQALYLKYYLNL
jgi:hypothetical protein